MGGNGVAARAAYGFNEKTDTKLGIKAMLAMITALVQRQLPADVESAGEAELQPANGATRQGTSVQVHVAPGSGG